MTQCRPLSVSMGNAIKYLKLQITHTPPDMAEDQVNLYIAGVQAGGAYYAVGRGSAKHYPVAVFVVLACFLC